MEGVELRQGDIIVVVGREEEDVPAVDLVVLEVSPLPIAQYMAALFSPNHPIYTCFWKKSLKKRPFSMKYGEAADDDVVRVVLIGGFPFISHQNAPKKGGNFCVFS